MIPGNVGPQLKGFFYWRAACKPVELCEYRRG